MNNESLKKENENLRRKIEEMDQEFEILKKTRQLLERWSHELLLPASTSNPTTLESD